MFKKMNNGKKKMIINDTSSVYIGSSDRDLTLPFLLPSKCKDVQFEV